MKIRHAVIGLAIAAFVAGGSAAQAQGKAHAKVTARAGKLVGKAKDSRHEARVKARKQLAKRARRLGKNGTPAQQAWAKSLETERQTLKASVTSGAVTKKAAGEQLRQWELANRPPKKK